MKANFTLDYWDNEKQPVIIYHIVLSFHGSHTVIQHKQLRSNISNTLF